MVFIVYDMRQFVKLYEISDGRRFLRALRLVEMTKGTCGRAARHVIPSAGEESSMQVTATKRFILRRVWQNTKEADKKIDSAAANRYNYVYGKIVYV